MLAKLARMNGLSQKELYGNINYYFSHYDDPNMSYDAMKVYLFTLTTDESMINAVIDEFLIIKRYELDNSN